MRDPAIVEIVLRHAVRVDIESAAQRPVTLWAHSAETGARLAAERENRTYLPGVTFPPNVRVATDDAHLGEPYRLYLVAVPSACRGPM